MCVWPALWRYIFKTFSFMLIEYDVILLVRLLLVCTPFYHFYTHSSGSTSSFQFFQAVWQIFWTHLLHMLLEFCRQRTLDFCRMRHSAQRYLLLYEFLFLEFSNINRNLPFSFVRLINSFVVVHVFLEHYHFYDIPVALALLSVVISHHIFCSD